MRDYTQRAGGEGVRWETGPNYFSNVVVLAEQLFLPFSSAFFRVITGAKSQRACTFVLNGERLALYFQHQRVYLKESPLSWRRNDVAEDLAHISALADALGAQLYYLYLPGPEEIYIPLLGSAAEKDACTTAIFSAYASGRFEMNSVLAAYEEALGNRAPRLLNATPYLQQAAGEGAQLTWTYDFHPNALGHQRIAEFVATHVGTP